MTKDHDERIKELIFSCGVEAFHDCEALASCLHDEVSENDLKIISKRIKQLTVSIYKAGIQSTFESTVTLLHDEVIGIVLLSLLDGKGMTLNVDKTLRADAAVALLKKEIISRNEKVVDRIMLEFSGREVYELLCDFSKSHGRDMDLQGPPCACWFARCLSCFQTFVQSTVRLPPDVDTVNRDLECYTRSVIDCKFEPKREKVILPAVGPSQSAAPSAAAFFAEAWTGLSGLFWKVKRLLNPMEYPEVIKTVGRIRKTNGIVLWHTLLAIKLYISDDKRKGKAREEDGRQTGKGSEETEGKQSKEGMQEYLKPMELKGGSIFAQIGTSSRIALADACRTKGNDAFVQANYSASLRYYSWAIEYDRNDAIFHLNRAAVYLQLAKYAEAEQDCTSSITLDPNNPKAFYRRGLSRARQDKIALAAKDFGEVLFLQRNSKSKVYMEWKTVIEKHLKEAVISNLKGKAFADVRLPSQREILLQGKSREAIKSIEAKTTKVANTKRETTEPMTVEQVFHQVCFALAFSHILYRRTGVRIRIPLQRKTQ